MNRFVPLSECLEKVIDYRGKTPKKLGGKWSETGVRALSALNVKTDGLANLDEIKCVDEDLYRKWMKEEVRRGDILLTSEAPSGQLMVWESDEKIVLSQRLFGLRINGNFDNYYIKYYLQSDMGQREIFKNMSGSTVFGISAKMFDHINVPFRELPEQRRISSALRALDTEIELNRQINAELEHTVQLIYDYWFTQFDFPNDQGKPYKSSGGGMSETYLYGRAIPEAWQAADVGDVVKLQAGVSYSSEQIASKDGLPMINLGSIDKNREYRDEKIKYYSGVVSKNKIAYPGDMLLACTDLTSEGLIIGCPIFVPAHHPEFTFSMDLSKINIISDSVLPTYLYMTLRTSWYHEYIKRFSSGTNVHHLDTSGVLRYGIALPPVELQEKFEAFVGPIFHRINRSLIENQELAKLRDWLLPMLMNGQVEVAEVSVKAESTHASGAHQTVLFEA